MAGKVINIIIVEPSVIICQGINSILRNSGLNYNIVNLQNLNDLEQALLRSRSDIVIINPDLIRNQEKEFLAIKRRPDRVAWIGIVYSYLEQPVLSLFDGVIYISDSPNKIITSLHNSLSHDSQEKHNQENLSEREVDVLKLLVAGNSNKEIADKLNISTHTVITHRKNISQKTGIKSVSGLTIYSVVKNIISVDDYRE